jgi:hypothetical protein
VPSQLTPEDSHLARLSTHFQLVSRTTSGVLLVKEAAFDGSPITEIMKMFLTTRRFLVLATRAAVLTVRAPLFANLHLKVE